MTPRKLTPKRQAFNRMVAAQLKLLRLMQDDAPNTAIRRAQHDYNDLRDEYREYLDNER